MSSHSAKKGTGWGEIKYHYLKIFKSATLFHLLPLAAGRDTVVSVIEHFK